MPKTPPRQISGYFPMRKSKGSLIWIHTWHTFISEGGSKLSTQTGMLLQFSCRSDNVYHFFLRLWHIVDVLASYQNCRCYFNPTRIPHHRHHLCHYHLCHFCHTRRRRHHIIRWHPPLTAFKILIRWTRPPGLGQKMFRNHYFLINQQSFLLVTYTENRCNPCSSSTI